MRQGQIAVSGPERIGGDVRDDHWLGAVGGCSARTRGRADGATIDRLHVRSGQAGRRAMPETVGVRVQQEDRRQGTCGQFFDHPAQGVEDRGARVALGHHLQKPLLPGQQRLGPLPIFDVDRGSVPFDDVSHLVVERCVADQQPAIITVSGPDPDFALHRLPGCHRCAPQVEKPGQIVGMTCVTPSPTEQLFQGPTGEVHETLIDEVDGSVGQGAPGMCGNRVDDPPDSSFGLLCRGDVHHRSDELDEARFVAQGMSDDMDMLHRAVGHQQPILVIEVPLILRGTLDRLLDEGDVFRVDPLQDEVHGRNRRSVVLEDSIGLV